ncbi:MAG TPA: carbohydrate ABC transporter permease, partial [Thermoanaerobaculia bacterium]|nr:carbohydrate ABC transporter permease [Thermoanaerobaculia bacterium]
MKSFLINALLIVTGVLTAIPLLWMISASFMPTGEATVYPPRLLPSHATLVHYHELFTRMNFGRAFGNSLLI